MQNIMKKQFLVTINDKEKNHKNCVQNTSFLGRNKNNNQRRLERPLSATSRQVT